MSSGCKWSKELAKTIATITPCYFGTQNFKTLSTESFLFTDHYIATTLGLDLQFVADPTRPNPVMMEDAWISLKPT